MASAVPAALPVTVLYYLARRFTVQSLAVSIRPRTAELMVEVVTDASPFHGLQQVSHRTEVLPPQRRERSRRERSTRAISREAR